MSPSSVQLVCLLVLFGAEGQQANIGPVSAEFTLRDRNGDGVWTRSEILTSADILSFLATDHDGDFLVPLAEYLETLPNPTNPAWKVFQQLDVNRDGVIDRVEFMPDQGESTASKAAAAEFTRHDLDGDDKLNPAEFLSAPRSALSAEARFRWMDADENGGVTQAELEALYAQPYRVFARVEFLFCGRELFPDIRLEDWLRRDWKRTRTFKDEFWLRDMDSNQQLTVEEFAVWAYGNIAPATRQLFLIFDFDQNGTLSLTEFRAIPGESSEAQCIVPDPILTAHDAIRDRMLAVLRGTQREEWTEATWPKMSVNDVIGVPSLCEPVLWDLDKNGTITLVEVERSLRGAFGLETWTEPALPLRKAQSQVFNQTYYDSLDMDHDGRLSKDEFIKQYYLGAEGNPKAFAEIDSNSNDFIDLDEILAGPWFMTSMVNEFRRLDLDLDGKVDPQEYDKQTYAWHQSLRAYVFPAFDRNGDGFLSLLEYRETPAANHVLDWFRALQDVDGSGTLTFDEFLAPTATSPPLKLSLLRKRMFDRFDRNSDHQLDSQEFPFSVNLGALTAEASFRNKDRDQSGAVSWEELSLGIAADRQPALRQLFLVFDGNDNQQLEWTEFRALPDLFRPSDRLIPDSLRDARDGFLAKLKSVLQAADKNHDGLWKRDEWPEAAMLLPLLNDPAATAHQVWDFDQNGDVTAEEVGSGADLAFGLIDPVERKWTWHPTNGSVFYGTNGDTSTRIET